jgi:hypothetical protein
MSHGRAPLCRITFVTPSRIVRRDPAPVLGRAVAVGHVLGAAAGLRETDRLR